MAAPFGTIDPFDAFTIWQASQPPKTGEIDAYANARLTFGEIDRDSEGLVYVPIRVDGDAAGVGALHLSTLIDPAFATVIDVRNELGEGWMFNHTTSVEGEVRLAAIGLTGLSTEGNVAVLVLELAADDTEFALRAEAAVNGNPVAALDEVSVVELPETFALQGNYPNPFNARTTISIDLPEAASVEVEIVDMLGRQVLSVPAQDMSAGAQRSIQVDGSNLASGSYFYRVIAKMESSTRVESGRMMLVK